MDSESPDEGMRFNGPAYDAGIDRARLTHQHLRIRELMLDGTWRTLAEISATTGDPPASVSAQLRHLRKPRFGQWLLDRRKRGDRKRGLFEYRLLSPDPGARPAERRRLLSQEEASVWVDALKKLVLASRKAGMPDDPSVIELGRWLRAQVPPEGDEK